MEQTYPKTIREFVLTVFPSIVAEQPSNDHAGLKLNYIINYLSLLDDDDDSSYDVLNHHLTLPEIFLAKQQIRKFYHITGKVKKIYEELQASEITNEYEKYLFDKNRFHAHPHIKSLMDRSFTDDNGYESE